MTTDDAETWQLIYAQRRATADMLSQLSPEQCAQPSLCAGWTVHQAAGHILQSAEQTTGAFMKGMVVNGFRFNTMIDKSTKKLGALPMPEIVARIRARLNTTNRAPAPVVTMLGEVVTHTGDIVTPLGIDIAIDPAALVACLDCYKVTAFPVGTKKRIAGLRLAATDVDWSYGDGPEVSGPGLSLLLAMTGRKGGLARLEGPGLATLAARMPA